MPDNDLHDRIESLEERLMHLEAALDELTRTLLQQELLVNMQSETIRRLEARIESLTDGGKTDPQQEPPPPHY